MADILLLHHAQGLTAGVEAFAEALRMEGFRVKAPDMFDGRTFPDVDSGVAFAQTLDDDVIMTSLEGILGELDDDAVLAGFSWGSAYAELLVLDRPASKGALFYHDGVPPSALGGTWPAGVAAQVHAMEGDPWMDWEGVDALVAEAPDGLVEVFRYPGTGHLFSDSGSVDYDEPSATLLWRRTLDFLRPDGDPAELEV